jgi:hypothetical protein
MGIEQTVCTNCKCDCEGEESFNNFDHNNKINNQKSKSIQIKSFKFIDDSTKYGTNNNGYMYLSDKSNLDNPEYQMNYSNLFIKHNNKSKRSTRKLNKNEKIVLIQSYIRGYQYRKMFPNIKQSLKIILSKKIESSKLLYEQSFQLQDPLKPPFDVNSYKKYYPSQTIDQLTTQIKNDLLLPCKLLIYNDNTSYYIGHVNIANQRNGKGILIDYKTNSKREGFWCKNKLIGWSRITDSKGNIFEGLFKSGVLNGKGEKHFVDGTVYKGDFVNGLKQGDGVEENKEYLYKGNFNLDRKEGKGSYYYKLKNDLYIGEFKNGNITGNGKYIWNNSDVYEGSFLKGKMHGKGKYLWGDGDEYEGEYVDGIKEGDGMFKWNNGKIYKGKFVNGKPHGKGVFYSDDKVYDVEFEDGKMTSSKEIKES